MKGSKFNVGLREKRGRKNTIEKPLRAAMMAGDEARIATQACHPKKMLGLKAGAGKPV